MVRGEKGDNALSCPGIHIVEYDCRGEFAGSVWGWGPWRGVTCAGTRKTGDLHIFGGCLTFWNERA